MSLLFIGENPKRMGGIETFGRNLSSIFEEKISFLSFSKEKNPIYKVDNVYELDGKNVLKKIFRKQLSKKTLKKHKIFILNSPKYLKLFQKGETELKILVQHQTSNLYWTRKFYFNKDTKILQRVQKEVSKTVTLSPYDKDDFIKKFNLDKEKVTFIRHTSHMQLLENHKKKSKNLIMVSRLVNHHKRLDLAIESMRKLPEFTLNIYGSGPDEKMLKDLSKEMKNIIFHGPTNKVQEKLDENGIYIITSDYEGYPISAIEAMRRGLPIVLRNTYTAAQDIVQGNGVLLENTWDEDEFVKGVEQTYENYEEYSKKSVELGKRHDFEVIEKEWKKLIEELGEDDSRK